MSTQEEIIAKYAAQARREIEREEAKSEVQKRLEAGNAQLEAYSREFVELAKNASQHAPRMKELKKLMDEQKTVISLASSQMATQAQQAQAAAFQATEDERLADVQRQIASQPTLHRVSYTGTRTGVQVPQK
jgi:archaellum component FlaD/FlaE